MSTGFDPYHAWLGMPPGARPSNHYDLLGLKVFQSEPPIIAEAADDRIAKVKQHLAGAHAAAARQLIEQLTQARSELLAPASKKSYDAQLRAKLGMPPAPEPKQAVASRPAVPVQPLAHAAPVAPPTVPLPHAHPAMPVAAAPAAVPLAPHGAMPAGIPQAGPVVAHAVPLATPMMAQPAMPVMQGYAPGVPLAQPMMAGYAAAPANQLEDIAMPRRRQRRGSGGQMLAVVAVLIIVGAAGALGYVYREPLMAALEDKPQVVIHEGDQPTNPETAKAKPQGEQPAQKPVVSKQPEQTQIVTKMPTEPVAPPTRVVRKAPVAVKPKQPPTAISISIKPQTPEEKAAVARSLAAARSALAERNRAKVEEQLNLAMLEASSSEGLKTIDRMRTLEESVKEFWHAVAESCKGLKSVDELEIDGKRMVVIDADTEHLSVRADGQVRDYKLEKLPTNMALYLAEQWLQPNDPSSKVVLGAFLAVDPKGDRQQARVLWEEAAGQGSEVAKILLAQDAD